MKSPRTVRGAAPGFSLVENLFAALILASVMIAMSQVLTSYTLNHGKASDIEFAINLATSQLDEVEKNLVTQNSMAFDTAPTTVNCPYCPRGRTYFISAENLTVTRYFFNNFPVVDANNTPADQNLDNAVVSPEVPWLGTTGTPLDGASIYGPGGYTDPSGNAWAGPYIQYTLFSHDRFFDAGGGLLSPEGAPYPFSAVQAAMSNPDPPRYAVRFQLYGVPAELQGNVQSGTNISNYLACGDQSIPTPGAIKAPSSCKQLIADSNINDVQAQGGMYIYAQSSELPSDSYYPYFFDHFTSKILETKVYRISDFLNLNGKMSIAGEFYDGTHFTREVASASVLLEGRLQLR